MRFAPLVCFQDTIDGVLKLLAHLAAFRADPEHPVVLGQPIGRPRRELTLTGEWTSPSWIPEFHTY